MLAEAAKISDIAPGGVLGVTLNGINLVICNHNGEFYALEGNCGHAAARLDRGALSARAALT